MKALANQSHLAMQSLDNLNLEEINPLTPEIISRQATQNIGTIGHVAHGKSTLVLAVSGVSVSKNTRTLFNISDRNTPFFFHPKNATVLLANLFYHFL